MPADTLPGQRRAQRVVAGFLWAFVAFTTVGFLRPSLAHAELPWVAPLGAAGAALAPLFVLAAAAYLHWASPERLGRFGRIWVVATSLWVLFACLHGLLGYGNPPADAARDLLCYLVVIAGVRLGCSAIFWRAARLPLVASVVIGMTVLLASWYELDEAFRAYGPGARVVRDVSLGRTAFMLGALPILLYTLRRQGWAVVLLCCFAFGLLLLLQILLQRRLEFAYITLLAMGTLAMASLGPRWWMPAPRIPRAAAIGVFIALPAAIMVAAPREVFLTQAWILAGRLQGVGIYIPDAEQHTGRAAATVADREAAERAAVVADAEKAAAAATVASAAGETPRQAQLFAEEAIASEPLPFTAVGHGRGMHRYDAGIFGPFTRQNERLHVLSGCIQDLDATELVIGRGLGGAFRWPAYINSRMNPDLRAARVRLHWLHDQGYIGRREMEVGHGNPLLKGGAVLVALLWSATAVALWSAARAPRTPFRLACGLVVLGSFLYSTMGGDYLPSTTYRSLVTAACIGWLLAPAVRRDPWADATAPT